MKFFKKEKPLLLVFLFVPLLVCFTVCAHPGGTDSDGGHYDRSTGEYHYHHGYPAHYHPDGVCPYEDSSDEDFSDEDFSDEDFYEEDSYEEDSSDNKPFIIAGAVFNIVCFLLYLSEEK